MPNSRLRLAVSVCCLSLYHGFVLVSRESRKSLRMQAWPEDYKHFVKAKGLELCGMSWVGYESIGPGAVVADGQSIMYFDKEKFAVSDDASDTEGVEVILSKINSYDPKKQFVVVFTSEGVQGADIVTPSIPPPRVASLPEFINRPVATVEDPPAVTTTASTENKNNDAITVTAAVVDNEDNTIM